MGEEKLQHFRGKQTQHLHQNSLRVKQHTLHLHHPQQHWNKTGPDVVTFCTP
ncbi:Pyridinium-3,5-bisthiocarboxylic acid mononucleotide nickel insertion protein [Clarias magur]|uniref:Pyridinium-3,5-bisthiocarboxylic acid mononucleotide nickel insertion protein n=1 Tax=Clarias magur TaxID=1594786 RepID=A0A8J4X0P0_CLAMG|nr:Pyridinium-3,5-bisthiocarboxylic acid mononucleotide nickel insertion protein [Clarias magur]